MDKYIQMFRISKYLVSFFENNLPKSAHGFRSQCFKFDNMDVVKNIIEIRKLKGVNQEIIADVLNVDISTISKIENGSRKLKVDELSKIAECLRVRVIDLFTYPKVYVDKDSIENSERISVTFEVSPDKRDYLLKMVTGEK